jgi:hypothetical protein
VTGFTAFGIETIGHLTNQGRGKIPDAPCEVPCRSTSMVKESVAISKRNGFNYDRRKLDV